MNECQNGCLKNCRAQTQPESRYHERRGSHNGVAPSEGRAQGAAKRRAPTKVTDAKCRIKGIILVFVVRMGPVRVYVFFVVINRLDRLSI